MVTWSADYAARIWNVLSADPIQSLKHDREICGVQWSRNQSSVLTWSEDGTARVWDVNQAQQIQTFKHDGEVIGAKFSIDELQVLAWSDDGMARVWDASDHLGFLTPAERILELEVRSCSTLVSTQNLRTLTTDEWQSRATSMEYASLEEKLATRKLGAAQAGQ